MRLKDYGLQGSLFADAAGIAWQNAKGFRAIYDRNKSVYVDHNRALRNYMDNLIGDVFAYGNIGAKKDFEETGRGYSVYITENGNTPFLFSTEEIDAPTEALAVRGSGRKKLSAFAHMQEFLNASPEYNWGLVSDGRHLRLLRDSSSLSRPAWLEFDLEKMYTEDRYADFCAMWRILHESRAVVSGGLSIWERWRTEGLDSGTRVMAGLRFGVREAIITLGSGFLQNERNSTLRDALNSGRLTANSFYSQLLRVIYRMIFIFTLEERGLLHTPATDFETRDIYAHGYSMRRLRIRCLYDQESAEDYDLWTACEIVFCGLGTGCPQLGLPALDGLFSRSATPEINELTLDNRSFLSAIRSLRWSSYADKLAPVDYKNMDSEEMGSIYESLLEYIPKVDTVSREFRLEGDENAGNERKQSGSYYTPTSLVTEIIESALMPVIDARLKEAFDQESSLLSVSVLDPACGSGHFLVAAARKLAERLAQIRANDCLPTRDQYQTAMRDVISHCIYGVDINPLALELCKAVLWLEGFDSSRPLSFLDAHLICGDSLLGIIDPNIPLGGIPDEAYKALAGDDKELCKRLRSRNNKGLDDLKKSKGQSSLFQDTSAEVYETKRRKLEAMPDGTLAELEAKALAFRELEAPDMLCDLYMAAFIAQKNGTEKTIPTSFDISRKINGGDPAQLAEISKFAKELCLEKRVLNWPAKFPLVMSKGGFDCVIGNPPWEKIKLQEKEWFAPRVPIIAKAQNKAKREAMIKLLAAGRLTSTYPDAALTPDTERKIYGEYLSACHDAYASSQFAHTNSAEMPGRFPLTGTGDVNMYALFAETVLDVLSQDGCAGIIVPTGIATDDSTKRYFGKLVAEERIRKLFCFENRKKLFPAVDSRMSFALMTIAKEHEPEYAFFLTDIKEKNDKDRIVQLNREDLARINPNTLTVPVLRSAADAALAKKIYKRVPVLINDLDEMNGNPWNISFMRMLDMSNDSNLFMAEKGSDGLPLYEGKMLHQYDSRWATFDAPDRPEDPRNVTEAEKQDPLYEPKPRYWVRRKDVLARIADVPRSLRSAYASGDVAGMTQSLAVWACNRNNLRSPSDIYMQLSDLYGDTFNSLPNDIQWRAECAKKEYADCEPLTNVEEEALKNTNIEEFVSDLMERRSPKWLMGWRDICRNSDERTLIATIFPTYGVNNKIPLMIFKDTQNGNCSPLLIANLLPLVYDYVARLKIGGTSMNYFIFKQIPVLSLNAYTQADITFINSRVIKLIYTTESLRPWAVEMGYKGDPYHFDSERRALLRAELDAYYAKLYGLDRRELEFILDPSAVMGDDYPTVTFTGLKANEIRNFGEYRTKRLVLEAWDRLIAK